MAHSERQMSPRVSVLIPCYNAAQYLEAALNSVLAQTYTDYEIIVVDDGSTDDTAQVAARYPQVRYIRQEHRGVSAARNTALAQAQGRLIAYLDADDLWLPDKLEKQVNYLNSHPDCQVVYTQVQNFFDGDPDTMSQRQRQLLNANTDQNVASACIRRELYDVHGMYREDLSYGEDTHWVLRVCAAGVDMKHYIPEKLYRRRIHDRNISLRHEKTGQKEILSLLADAIRHNRKKG